MSKNKKALAKVGRATVDDFIDRWNDQKSIFQDLVKSSFLPDAVKTPEQAMAIVLAGKELGIGPMTSLQEIRIIKGTPSSSPKLMWALARKSGKLAWMKVKKNDKLKCTIEIQRTDEPGITHTDTFTIGEASEMKTKEDGKVVPLTEKFNWRTMPAVMLYSRCSSRICRRYLSDVIMNLFTEEEMIDTVIDGAEETTAEPVPERIDLAPGIVTHTFDPMKESITEGNHAGTIWIELPEDYLIYLRKNSVPKIAWMANVTLKIREQMTRQQKEHPPEMDETFGPQQRPEPTVPDIDILESELEAIARSGNQTAIKGWAKERKIRIEALKPATRKQLKTKFDLAMKEAKPETTKEGIPQ